MDKSREQFHEYMLERPGAVGDDIVRKLKNGEYVHIATQLRWEVWQASRAAVEIELPDSTEFDGPDMSGAQQAISQIRETLTETGIKVKS